MRRIQKIIHVTKATATIDISPPKRSCASKLRLLEVKVSSAPNAEGQPDGGGDAEPDRPQPVAVPGLDQVRDQDAHHEGGLEALTQADQVVGEHRGSLRRQLLK